MNRPYSPDSTDTRVVFRIYAVLAFLAGFLLLGAYPTLRTTLVSEPWAARLLFRLVAACVMAAGCSAIGMAQIEDPEARHRALGYFALGHLLVLAMALLQILAMGEDDPGDIAVPVLGGATLCLFYFWQTGDGHRAGDFLGFTDLMNGRQPSVEQLRSKYDEQIREAASQEERNRLARELHDSIKQQIFAVQTAAATAQTRFDDDRTGAREALGRVRDSAREAMTEMEAMLDHLRAAPLENVGLVQALKKQCEALQFRTGAAVSFDVGGLPPSEALPPGAQMAVFRVAQEAFANIARHARASRVRVALGTAGSSVTLDVEDDGLGFEAAAAGSGMGLGNMKARAQALGGRVCVDDLHPDPRPRSRRVARPEMVNTIEPRAQKCRSSDPPTAPPSCARPHSVRLHGVNHTPGSL